MDDSPRVRRVRFAGLSEQPSSSVALDGAVDDTGDPGIEPRRYNAIWNNLKRKMPSKSFLPRVEYPGWPAAAYKAPPFVQWLKYFLITLLIGAIFSVVTLSLFLNMPYKSERIQMHEAYLTGILPTYAYRLFREQGDVWGIVPVWSVILLALGIPIVIYLASYLVIRSFWDLNNAFCGTNLACLAAFILTGFLKYLVGSPRPYFVSLCRPNLDMLTPLSRKTHKVAEICTFDSVGFLDRRIALQSFPSGHAATAFAGFTFLSLWLRARMYSHHIIHRDKGTAGSNAEDAQYPRHTHFLLSLLVILPLWAASVVALLVVRDHIHHWWDAVGGAVIGILCAFNSWNNFYREKSAIPVLPKGWAERVRKMNENTETV